VTVAEALQLIRPAVRANSDAMWADFGAGQGTFTEALAQLLGKEASVLAVDSDARALRDLRRLALQTTAPSIQVTAGDVRDLHAIPALGSATLDGALFANVLHFVDDPQVVLHQVKTLLKPDGRVVVIEYDRRLASRWVPFPLPPAALAKAARAAGLSEPVEIGRRASRYQGELYCAISTAATT
jgi:ubiquinone/menaquinone biosynthesis C-methylase UbiE